MDSFMHICLPLIEGLDYLGFFLLYVTLYIDIYLMQLF